MTDDARYQRFNLRVPRELLACLQAAADARSRSTNAEIVARLEGSLGEGKSETGYNISKLEDDVSFIRRKLDVSEEKLSQIYQFFFEGLGIFVQISMNTQDGIPGRSSPEAFNVNEFIRRLDEKLSIRDFFSEYVLPERASTGKFVGKSSKEDPTVPDKAEGTVQLSGFRHTRRRPLQRRLRGEQSQPE